MKKTSLYTVFSLIFVFEIHAQIYPPSFYRTLFADTTVSANDFGFRIENSNFLKNDEYFNNIIQGYTLLGWFVNPKFFYYPIKNLRIEAGGHFLMYSGLDKLTQMIPTLSAQYRASKSTDIILGTLNSSTNHEMIEPMFRYEYFFTENNERGLQFLFHTNRYQGDLWVNWQNFIFKGEDAQEIFTLGFSNRFYITPKESKHQLSVPLQFTFVHHGGQINETIEKLQTINNSAVGLSYKYRFSNSSHKYIGAEQYYLIYDDLSGSDYQFPYIRGYGVYSKIYARAGNFYAKASWWYSDHFISLRGNPIFQSHSTIWTSYYEKKRAIISGKILYEKNLTKGLNLGAGFEVFSDLYNYNVDYWYQFYINFSRDFFIRK